MVGETKKHPTGCGMLDNGCVPSETKSEVVDGFLIKYHANGNTVWSKGKLNADNQPDGYWEWYRVDGTLKRSGHFDNGTHNVLSATVHQRQ